MDKCKASAWSTTNEVATMVAGKFTYTKVISTIQSKRLFLVMYSWTNMKHICEYVTRTGN